MKSKLSLILRLVLGLIMVIFGLNKFFDFLPPMEGLPDKATAFFGALIATGYMIKLIAISEIIGGLLLLIGKWIPFALVFLTPIILNIFFFHMFLDLSQNMVLALVVTIIHLILLYKYKNSFNGLFS